MEKIKVIDLLNKIANGEDVPKKIKYGCYEYIYEEDDLGFVDYIRGFRHFFGEDYTLDDAFLNNYVEIIEEDKKIEKLDLRDYEGLSCLDLHIVFNDKINEIIEIINKENK